MRSSLTNVNLIYHHTDGEGRSVRRDIYKQTNGYNTFEKTEYSIYSSVLGKALTEVKSDGAKKKTNVYGAGGQLVATQNAASTTLQHVAWSNIDPSSASYLPATHTGMPVYLGEDGQAELDPLGSNVQTSNPFANQPELMQAPGGGGWGDPFGGYGCRMDGFETPCSQVAFALSVGFAKFDQNFEQPPGVGHWADEDDWDHKDEYGFPGTKTQFVPFFNVGFDMQSEKDGNQERNENQDACDKRLARIFGDEDAVIATLFEPETLKNRSTGTRHSVAGLNRDYNKGVGPNPRESPFNGVAHLYATPTGDGKKDGFAYTPPGYSGVPSMLISPNKRSEGEIQSTFAFTYLPGSLKQYGYDGGLRINFVHSGTTNSKGVLLPPDPSVKNSMGSIKVGLIGNYGMPFPTGGDTGGFVHDHMLFNIVNKNGVMGARIDPRKVFCKNLGF